MGSDMAIQNPGFDAAFLAKSILAVLDQMERSIPGAVVLDPVQSELYDLISGIEDDLYRIIGMSEYRRSMTGQTLVGGEQ